ncbi:helix-turn-helix transcriptional regulator [Klebsiella spallanzanii]|nr:LuxR C-terminal-related transcriptional regulator [Klebsiella spallanzanii]
MLSTKAATDTTGLRLALVDVDGILAGKADWQRISEGMAESDVCVFMSLRGMRVQGLPWLSVDTPVAVLRRALASTVRYGLSRREGLSRSALLAPLSQAEREVFLFLLCGYELTEIHESVGVSRKTMYSIKSKILRRLGLESTRELCAVLRLCEFAEFHEHSVYQSADRGGRAVSAGEYASLAGRAG